MKRCLAREHRALSDPRADDWQKINWLREWVYGHVPDATFSLCLDAGHGSVWGADVSRILCRLALEQRGFKCAGASLILYKLCSMFGYKACVYNAGDSEGSRASHAVTLVEIGSGSGKRVGVLDPYFNQALEDDAGRPLDFRTAITLLVRGRDSDIRLVGGYRKRITMMTTTDQGEVRRFRAAGAAFTRPRAGVVFCAYESTLTDWVRHQPEVPIWLRRYAGRENPLYLLLFPLGIHGDEEFVELDDWVRAQRRSAGADPATPASIVSGPVPEAGSDWSEPDRT